MSRGRVAAQRSERPLAVLLPEERGIGQARAHHALVAGAHLSGSRLSMLLTVMNQAEQRALRILAPGNSADDPASVEISTSRGSARKRSSNVPASAHRPFDQRRHLIEQCGVDEGAAADLRRLRHDLIANRARGARRNRQPPAPLAQRARVAGRRGDSQWLGRMKAMAALVLPGGQYPAASRGPPRRRTASPASAPAARTRTSGRPSACASESAGDRAPRARSPGSSCTASTPGFARHEEQRRPLALIQLLQSASTVDAAAFRKGECGARGLAVAVECGTHGRPAPLDVLIRLRDSEAFHPAPRGGAACERADLAVRQAAPARARCARREANARSSSGKRLRRQLLGAEFDQEIPLRHACERLLWHQHREAQRLAAGVVRLRHGARQRAHAQDVALALGHGDRAARIQQVEGVRGLQHLLVGRQRQLRREQRIACRLVLVEVAEQHGDVRRARSCRPTARLRSGGRRRDR